MRCPKCNCNLSPWAYDGGGGYVGLSCVKCNKEWHSDKFAEMASQAEKKAIKELLESTDDAPDDLITMDDIRKSLKE